MNLPLSDVSVEGRTDVTWNGCVKEVVVMVDIDVVEGGKDAGETFKMN